MKCRKPLKRVSDKRAKEQKEYLRLRADFLKSNPYCQVWLNEHGIKLEEVLENDGWAAVYINDPMVRVPLATDVHHTKGRYGGNYLKVETWLAVSRQAHQRIHSNPSWAREAQYLQ